MLKLWVSLYHKNISFSLGFENENKLASLIATLFLSTSGTSLKTKLFVILLSTKRIPFLSYILPRGASFPSMIILFLDIII